MLRIVRKQDGTLTAFFGDKELSGVAGINITTNGFVAMAVPLSNVRFAEENDEIKSETKDNVTYVNFRKHQEEK